MKKIAAILITFFLISTHLLGQVVGNFKTNDGFIHYKVFGKGTPLLIINGGPGMNSDGFSPLAELLSDKFMTILSDQRGTGKSELKTVDSSTVTMDLMIQDIEALRKHLHIKKWVILGHSFGGWLAQYYASKYPENLDGLILSGSGGIDLELLDYFSANTAIRLGISENDSLAYWNKKITDGDTTYNAKFQRSKVLASAYLFKKDFIPVIAKRLTQAKPIITGLVFKDLYKINYNCKKSLENFAKRVLIIQGRQDIVGDGTAYKAHLILKNSTLIFLNNCGHYGWIDQKEKYKLEIVNFISNLAKL